MMLLVMTGVETNPGPRGQSFRLGVFNAGVATKKAAGIHDIFHQNKLDALALCETISETTHDAVKGGLAPTDGVQNLASTPDHSTRRTQKGRRPCLHRAERCDRHYTSNAVH